MNVQAIAPQRAAELFAIRKTRWLAPEYRALADRYADAALALQIAIENENFAGWRSAYLTLHEIAHQTQELNTGLMRAIDSIQQPKEFLR